MARSSPHRLTALSMRCDPSDPPGPCQEAEALVAATMARAEAHAKLERERFLEQDRNELASTRARVRAKGHSKTPAVGRPCGLPSTAEFRAQSVGSVGYGASTYQVRRPCSATVSAPMRSTSSTSGDSTLFREATKHAPLSELRLAQDEVLRSVQAMQKAFSRARRSGSDSSDTSGRQRSSLEQLRCTQLQRDLVLDRLLRSPPTGTATHYDGARHRKFAVQCA